MAKTLPGWKMDEIALSFKAIDVNNDGKLSLEEFQLALAEHGPSPEQVSELYEALDQDKSGKIDYNEFVAANLISQEYLSSD